MNILPTLGLRTRLMLIVLMAFVVLGGANIWQALDQRDALIKSSSQRLLNDARLLAAQQQVLIGRADAILNSLMLEPNLARYNDHRCSAVLMAHLKSETAFFQLGKVLPNGDVACTAVSGRKGVNLNDRPWFQQVLHSPEMVISEVTVSRLHGVRVINFLRAQRDERGQVLAVFYVSVSMAHLQQALTKTSLPEGARVAVLDGQGTVVLHYPDPNAMLGRSLADKPGVMRMLAQPGDGIDQIVAPDHMTRLVAFTPFLAAVGGPPLRLLVSLPKTVVEAPVREQLLENLATTLTVLLATLGLVLWGGRRYLVQPLKHLSHTARRFGTGNLQAQPESHARNDEIGELARELDAMALALQQSTVSRETLQYEVMAHELAELQLERSELTLNQAARLVHLGAWSLVLNDVSHLSWNPVTWSLEMYHLLDYAPESITRPTSSLYMARVHPDDRETLKARVKQALANKSEWHIEYRFVLTDGSVRLVEEIGSFFFDAAGDPISMHGAVIDITEQRRIENQLRESETRLRLALEGAGAGSWEWNFDSGQDVWSAELWALLGLVPNAAPASYASWCQAVHPDDLVQAQASIAQSVARKQKIECEFKVQLPADAAPRWLLIRGHPMLAADGQLLRYRGIMMDISERKLAEISLVQYRQALEDRVAERTAELWDAAKEQQRLNLCLRLLGDCNMALVQSSCEDQLLAELCRLVVQTGGYQLAWVGMAEQDPAKTVRVVAQYGDVQGYLAQLSVSWDATQTIGRGPMGLAIQTGETQVCQDFRQNPQVAPWLEWIDKSGYQSGVALPLLLQGQVFGALTIYSDKPYAFGQREESVLEALARDMSFGLASLRARKELEHYQQQLEALVAQRTGQIDALNRELAGRVQEAEAANRAKSFFLSTMSHELRTPLNAVVGLAGLLADTPLRRRQRDYTDKIQLSAQTLRVLIDDVLDFTKIEAGALRLEQVAFSLNSILRTTAGVMGTGLRGKPVEALFQIDQNVPDALIGDALRIQQILMNLISNAVKFTERGEVVVSVRCLAQDPAQVTLQFSVRDTGIGIPVEKMGAIFEVFSQVDSSTSRLYGGTGLGLAISARLACLMGGQIGLDSAPGLGSEFHFELTLPRGPEQPKLASTLIPAELSVLIVDDHAMAREVLTQTCRAFGWQATAVDSAQAGLAELVRSAAQGSDYDLMLLDWRMPGTDGLEMLRQAYVTPGLGLPLVVLMASIFEMELAAASSDELFLDSIVAKPMTPASLYEAVKRIYAGDSNTLLPAPSVKSGRRLSGMRLLVAEDNLLNQEVIEQVLSRAGATVVLVGNGQAAVDAVRTATVCFDAVLMDIQMPVLDGYSATRIIRDELGLVDLPIIAVTAFARPEDYEKSRQAGMVGHMVKPLVVEDLIDIVAKERQSAAGQPAQCAQADSSAWASVFELAGFNMAAALETFGRDERVYLSLLCKFSAQYGDVADQAQRLFDAGALEEAARLLHGLSGVSSLMHATELAGLARAAEAALLAGQVQQMPTLLAQLQAAMEVVLASIGQLEDVWMDATWPPSA